MIDLRAARRDPDAFRTGLARKGAAPDFDRLLEVDAQWRALQPRIDELRSQGKLKGKPTPEQLAELTARKEELQKLETELAEKADQGTLEEFTRTSITNPDAYVEEGYQEGVMPAFDGSEQELADLVAFLTQTQE